MRRLLSAIIALATTLTIVIPTFAQTPEASPAATPETQPYTGLLAGASRQYTGDPTKAPADDPESFVLISMHLFQFDTAEHAASTWTQLTEDATTPISAMGIDEDAGPEIHQGDINDLGDRAWAIWLAATTQEGTTGAFRMLYVLDGEYLIMASAMGGSEDNTLLADSITMAVTEREAGTGAASFSADGTSTGGIWDKLPRTGDPATHDLVAFADKEINVL